MNYVEWEKEYKETAQEVNNLIQKYNKQNSCITMAELLSEHKNSIAE